MLRIPRIAAVVAAAAAAAALAACGGEGDRAPVTRNTVPAVSQPAGSAAITDPARAAYVKLVDQVCSRYNPRRDAATAQAGEASDDHEAVADYDRSITLAERQLRGVEAIRPPAADRALIEHNVVDRLRERIALRRALRRDLDDADVASAESNRARLDALTIALESFGRGYGFRVCGAR